MRTPTVAIVLKRAMDVRPLDVIRLTPNGPWRFVYDVAEGGDNDADTEEANRITMYELDARYRLLRIDSDPHSVQVGKHEGAEHAWIDRNTVNGKPYEYGVPDEMDDHLVALHQYDLVEVQTLIHPVEPSEDRQGTSFELSRWQAHVLVKACEAIRDNESLGRYRQDEIDEAVSLIPRLWAFAGTVSEPPESTETKEKG